MDRHAGRPGHSEHARYHGPSPLRRLGPLALTFLIAAGTVQAVAGVDPVHLARAAGAAALEVVP